MSRSKSRPMEKSKSNSSTARSDPDKKQTLIIRNDGSTHIEWVSVPFSEFIIDHVMSKEERDQFKKMGTRKIYCG